MIDAIGTSLLAVSTFGSLTAARYAINGEINWFIALLFVIGGIIGGLYGTRLSSRVSEDVPNRIFGILLIVVAAFIIINSVLFWP